MNVFITGGSGLTGPAVVAELITGGHDVTGLARSDASAARLEGLGATVLRGDLDDLDALRNGARQADGVVHMAFGGDFTDPDDMARRDVAAIVALGEGLLESPSPDRPFVMTSGTFAMSPDRVSVETDEPDPRSLAPFRIPGEQACLGFAERGLRPAVMRLAPSVHGPADTGFIPMLIDAARRTGVSAYVGDGANRWPAVHRADAATLYRLVLEQAPAGTAWHAVDENSTLRSIADLIARRLDLPVRSVDPADAATHFASPFFGLAYAADAPASSLATRASLGWTPRHPTLLAELADGDYFDERE